MLQARSRWRALALPLLTALLATTAVVSVAAPATAAPGDVTSASLTWGVKESFRSYVTGPIASGAVTLGGGATGSPAYGWGAGSGSIDAETGLGTVSYPGTVQFTGHSGALDVSLSSLRVVRTSASAGEIVVDAVSKSMESGESVSYDDAAIATVDLSGLSGDETLTVSGAAATLTATGSSVFAGFYTAGTAMDPLTLSWPVEAAAEAEPEPQPEPEPEVPSVPTIEVSADSDLVYEGQQITVTGTGFAPNAPSTNGTRPPLAGQFAGVYVVFGSFADTWKPSEGATSATRKVAPGQQKWVVNPANVNSIGGTNAGAVAINADGSFEVTLTVSAEFTGMLADGNLGIYTYPGSGAVYAPFETATLLDFAPPTPSVTVTPSENLKPGDVVTVSGVNFGPVGTETNGTRPPLRGQFGGVYVVFGSFADVWQPSTGATSATRKVAPGQQKWVVNPANVATIGGEGAGAVAINDDGSFEVQLTVTDEFTGMLTDGNLGVYTFPGSGASYAPFETATLLDVVAPVPTVTVSQTEGLDEGDVITVTGENFGPDAPATNGTRPPLAGQFGGVYVVFGSFADEWQPSTGATSATRKVAPGQQKWVVNPENVDTIGGPLAGAVAIDGDGSFEVQLTVTEEFTGMLADGNLGVYTYPGSGAVHAPFETATFVTFAGPEPTTLALSANPSSPSVGQDVALAATVTPAAAGTVQFFDGTRSLGTSTVNAATGTATRTYADVPAGSRSLRAVFTPSDAREVLGSEAALSLTVSTPSTAGSLRWGFKDSFRSYVTGPIAQGSMSVSGASTDGGIVSFPQTSAAGATGAINYGGSVRFTGHSGALDVTFASPTVRMVSDSRADLVMTVEGSRVTLATLALNSGARSELPGGAVRYSGVPATLTSAGASVFSFAGSSFYPAGTAMDPVTFTVGAPSSASGNGGSTVVASYTEPSIPSTPPATTGAELTGDDPNAIEPGQRVTVSAPGFQSGETGIRVVIYSEPVVLSENVTADADGIATWSGTLPADLVGEHTLTLQGSVDRGIVLTIQQLAQTVALADACQVQDAALTWGFKETFRSYISGSIANGEWEVLDGATYETPEFGFTGAGAFDQATGAGELTFAGGIRFTGHGGILDTTVSNPRVIMLDAESGQLVLDVVGTTQEGEEVSAEGVVFADLDLSASSRSAQDGVLVISDIPAVLTATGAEAFGTYPAGDPLDPLTITATLADDCGEVVIAEPEAPVAEQPAANDLTWLWIALVALLLIVIAVLVTMLVRRRAAAE